MTRFHFWLGALAVSAALVVVSGTASPAPLTLNGTPLPEYDAPAGGLLAQIKARGTLVGGVEAQNPPFEYLENGKIVGFDIELSDLFAKSLGAKFEALDTAWAGVIPSLYTKKFDMIWSAMTITEPRKEAVTFSVPYASDQVEIIVKAGTSGIAKFDDLDGKTLGTQLNSAAELQAKELIKASGKRVELKSFDSFNAAYLDLKNGNVDAVTSTKLNDKPLFDKNPGAYKVAFTLPIYNYVGVATRKQDKDLSTAIETFLADLRKSGKLAELQTKWFGYPMDLPN